MTLGKEQLDRIRCLLKEGLLAEKAGDRQTAEERYDQCIAIDDGSEPSPDEADAWEPLWVASFRRAVLLENQGDCEGAIRLAQRASASTKVKPFALTIIGACCETLGRLREAEKAYREAIAIRSESPEAWMYVLLALVVRQDESRIDEARGILERAIEIDPRYEEAHYHLGVIYFQQDDFETARRHLELAIEIDPEYALAYRELGNILRKELYRCTDSGSQSDLARASEHHLKKAIELDPNNPWPQAQLINLYWKRGRLRRVEEECHKFIERFPASAMAHWTFGDFLASTNRGREKAEFHLKKAIELDDRDPQARYFYGKALLRWERWHEATAMLQQSHRLGDEGALPLLQSFVSPDDTPPK
jgi:tetratricopeptide (TPR) repeat protein